jgi:hypothetical protein
MQHNGVSHMTAKLLSQVQYTHTRNVSPILTILYIRIYSLHCTVRTCHELHYSFPITLKEKD